MNRTSIVFVARACFACAIGAASSAAQSSCDVFGPVTSDVHVSQTYLYDQIWSQVARRSTGIATAWSEGQDIWARLWDMNLNPITDQFLVNTMLNLDVQDEPAIAYATGGNILIAWSDRYGYDGQAMGIFAKLYDAHGSALTNEFQVNVTWQASQWRPLIAPTPSGGYVVAFSGNWDGDSFIRILDGNANALTPNDIQVNVFYYDAQVDPAPAVNSDGTIFVAFIDYSSHGNVGTGTNIYGRMFDAAGNPLQAQEFVLTSWAGDGDQHEPRVAADGLNRFIVVWEDEIHDGSGYCVMARIYDSAGVPIAPEFIVNTTTTGDQRAPRVAADRFGRFLVTYEDNSTGVTRILGQRFDASVNRIGGEFVVTEDPVNPAQNRTIAMSDTGGDVLLGYDVSGAPSPPGPGIDVFMRRYSDESGPFTYCTAKLNSQGCVPSIDFSGTPSVSDSSPFLITASNVLNKKAGLLLYASDSSFTPFQGGLLCVSQPLHRTASQNSAGSATGSDCSGHLSFDFNAYVHSHADPMLTVGQTVSAQYYYRDPFDPTGFVTGLTNGLRFTLCP
jgi:hypothetical protein